jgi:tetraacyldisaccharide 4'-kinase
MKPMDYRVLSKQMNLYAFQQLFFTTLNYGKLRPLFNGGKEYAIQNIHPAVHILMVTGIASPQKMKEDLSAINHNIHMLTFKDHHDFTDSDMLDIERRFHQLPEGKRMIITTEKDAVRMIRHPQLPETIKPYIYVLPVEITFMDNQKDIFNKYILDYVKKNTRNCSLFKK